MNPTKERAHSKFSASGAERWFRCPGSVTLSEGRPDKPSVWAEEGTKAHGVLETILKAAVAKEYVDKLWASKVSKEMWHHGATAANFICRVRNGAPHADLMVESRVYLDFIHPEMFGTLDSAVIDHFGTLHVFDYKYGAGHAVSPRENLQMIFYGVAVAHRYNWNFKNARLWIIQPRIKGYDGPVFWEITIDQLRKYVTDFKLAVRRVLREPNRYMEGPWCHWCKAKPTCPLKTEGRQRKAIDAFAASPHK